MSNIGPPNFKFTTVGGHEYHILRSRRSFRHFKDGVLLQQGPFFNNIIHPKFGEELEIWTNAKPAQTQKVRVIITGRIKTMEMLNEVHPLRRTDLPESVSRK